MLKNRKKKAFTIVELVIVIAVIAVLAAVLIPTFSNVIDKANTSADVNVVRNLNMILSSEAATEGKNATMTDALKDAEENGYTVEKLTPTNANNEILWDSVNDCFALKEKNATELNYCGVTPKETNVEDYQYFKIYNTKRPLTFKADGSVESDYSIYLGEGATSATELKVSTGIDVGENTGITSITYDRSSITDPNQGQDVVIRTNSSATLLKINAENDTVHHYGEGRLLDGEAIASASYHEHGYFPKATIAQGRLVVEDGNIPSVEITAIPTAEKPIKIETDKDIVVSASAEVVTALGENKLENVEVKVTSTEAAVVVDEKVDTAKVEAAGKTASDLITITKVDSLSDLLNATISEKAKYIQFTNDIHTDGTNLINFTYSATLDGNGYTLDGDGGLRGSVKQMICIGYNATERIDKVTIKNLNVETTTVTRPLECRGNTNEIVFDNVTMVASGSSNDQGFTYGGNEDSLLKLTVKNCDLSVGSDGYTFILFNPVDMTIENSTITGWAGLYFKSPSSSHGSRDSKVVVTDSSFICHNENWGTSNSFGAIVFEDGNINVTLIDTAVDVTENSDQEQDAIVFNAGWASYYGTYLTNGHVIIEGNSSINGKINCKSSNYDISNDIIITGGTFTSDPSDYVSEGHTVTRNGSLYIVK